MQRDSFQHHLLAQYPLAADPQASGGHLLAQRTVTGVLLRRLLAVQLHKVAACLLVCLLLQVVFSTRPPVAVFQHNVQLLLAVVLQFLAA